MILRASAGRVGDERQRELDDAALTEAVLADLDRVVGLHGQPREIRVGRWDRSLPQYAPGHLSRIDAVEAALEGSGIVLAGMALLGLSGWFIAATALAGLQAERLSPTQWRWQVLMIQPGRRAPEFRGSLEISFAGTLAGKPWTAKQAPAPQAVLVKGYLRQEGVVEQVDHVHAEWLTYGQYLLTQGKIKQ